MRPGYVFGLAFGLLVVATPPALAQTPATALPPHEITTILRSTSFDPVSRPVRRGHVYVVHAVDRYGDEVRLLVDAYNGRIRSVALAAAGPRYAPPPVFGPRLVMPPPYYGPGPRVVRVIPDDRPDLADEPAMPAARPLPRSAAPAAPAARIAAAPPLPRARPAEVVTGSVPAAKAPEQPAPEQAAPAANAPAPRNDGKTPPMLGFE